MVRPLLLSGTQFAAQSCCHGDGAEHIGASAATGVGAGRASQDGAAQAPGALSLGGAVGPHL